MREMKKWVNEKMSKLKKWVNEKMSKWKNVQMN